MKKQSNKLARSLLVGVATLTLAGCQTASNEGKESAAQDPNEAETTQVRVEVTSDITEAVEKVEGAVVSVINMQQQNTEGFNGLFGTTESAQEDDQLQTAGEGSGVIYKTEGDSSYVVTNNHVIEGSDAIEVLMKDGTKVEAELVGSDSWTDLAVLKISSENVTTVAEFGDSDLLNVGEPAIAIGSPLGTNYASSVTSGIISAKNRSVPADIDGDGAADWEMTAIQTDAAINPGNSGGALVNIAGQVIGINSMKISSDTVEGMGFAIPSNDVVEIIAELEANGEVVRPVLGISLLDLSQISEQQQSAVLELPDEVNSGVVVAQVEAGSAAEQGGLEQYDVIVGFNGEEITDTIELRQAIYSTDVGQEVEIEVYRGGELVTVNVTMTSSDDMM
ncbi:trypsin-like peptidase domain-containing protein [Desemzia incerta]|uniref:S1C family serine protease n=1 Tax=Desemzia incerta TaxID=82801 RepID=UPI0024C40908|nr:trypsin-like peptidase domain-containing protein [Desemzia incerta]WHZ32734.1 trypsin-like peptidase domain-containing protein [Desemzia incerta]